MIKLDKFRDEIGKVIHFLQKNEIRNPQIYLENSFEFIPVFFACLALDLEPLVLTTKAKEKSPNLLDDFSKFQGTDFVDFSIDENAVFFLKTSGSSGVAKVVKKQLLDMILEAKMLAKSFEWGDEFIASVSHQHLFGLTFKIFLPLVLERKIEPNFLNYPEFIYEQELENKTLISSPTILKALLQNPKKLELQKLKNIVCAGGVLDEKSDKELRQICHLINIYGSTETGVVARDIGFGMEIFDEVEAKICQTLVVSSPWCKEYQTSDLVEICQNKLKFFGRSDRVIKLNEKRISLDALENFIKNIDLIDDCVAGFDEKSGKIYTILELSELGKSEFYQNGKKGITTILKNNLKFEYQNSIRHFKIVSKIPRNSQGKFAKSDFDELLNSKEKFEFKLIEKSSTSAKFSAFVSYGLFYFSGHFMDFPLVPGFIQLEAICELARSLNLTYSDFKTYEAIKFSGFLRPGEMAIFELEIKNNKLYFTIKNGEKICSSGRICIS